MTDKPANWLRVLGALPDLPAGFLVLVAGALVTSGLLFREPLTIMVYALVCIVLYVFATLTIIKVWRQPRFGWANRITLGRLLITILLAALVPVLIKSRGADWTTPFWPQIADSRITHAYFAYALVALSAVCLLLDGVDGYVARKTRTVTRFGARFDMEVDAAFILVLCSLLWALGIAPVWVFAIGLMRYGFVAAGWALPKLSQPLPPSLRRKSVCVVQVIGLIGCLHPVVSSPQAAAILGMTLVLLVYSFLVDVRLLLSSE